MPYVERERESRAAGALMIDLPTVLADYGFRLVSLGFGDMGSGVYGGA